MSDLTDTQQAQLDALADQFEQENAAAEAAEVAAQAAATPDVVAPPAAEAEDVPAAPDTSAPAVGVPAEAAAPTTPTEAGGSTSSPPATSDDALGSLLDRLRLTRTGSQLATVADWLKEHGLVLK